MFVNQTNDQSTPSAVALDEGSTAPARPAMTTRHWVFACLLLLGVTWVPLLTVHLHRTWMDDDGTGTVVVIFPPTASTRTVFRRVIDADGAIVRPVSWARQVWVVRSVEPGFAGRLRRGGAWAVYSIDLLSANALFNCFRLARAPRR
jgi:hypothetical protein